MPYIAHTFTAVQPFFQYDIAPLCILLPVEILLW